MINNVRRRIFMYCYYCRYFHQCPYKKQLCLPNQISYPPYYYLPSQVQHGMRFAKGMDTLYPNLNQGMEESEVATPEIPRTESECPPKKMPQEIPSGSDEPIDENEPVNEDGSAMRSANKGKKKKSKGRKKSV